MNEVEQWEGHVGKGSCLCIFMQKGPVCPLLCVCMDELVAAMRAPAELQGRAATADAQAASKSCLRMYKAHCGKTHKGHSIESVPFASTGNLKNHPFTILCIWKYFLMKQCPVHWLNYIFTQYDSKDEFKFLEHWKNSICCLYLLPNTKLYQRIFEIFCKSWNSRFWHVTGVSLGLALSLTPKIWNIPQVTMHRKWLYSASSAGHRKAIGKFIHYFFSTVFSIAKTVEGKLESHLSHVI